MMSFIRPLLRHFRGNLKSDAPEIQGKFRLEVRERGKLTATRDGFNICTLTGREWLSELIALESAGPRTPYREDRIALIGLGTGAQPEVANVGSLVEPVPYVTGEFLASLAVPATLTSSGTASTNTGVQFIREFARNEVSLGFDVTLTEAGLFTDGDPDNNFSLPAPTDYVTASSRAPMFYKTFEPVTKTVDSTVRVIWEVRFV